MKNGLSSAVRGDLAPTSTLELRPVLRGVVVSADLPPDPSPDGDAEEAAESARTFRVRQFLVERLFSAVPGFVANRLRTQALRAAGISIGKSTLFWGLPTLIGSGERLRIGSFCGLNDGCFFELEENVTLGDHVSVGHDVMFLTRTFETGGSACRAGRERRAPIVVGDGAWIGARATVLPGVTIGPGAVIGACAVVHKDIAPNTLVMGAQQISIAKWR